MTTRPPHREFHFFLLEDRILLSADASDGSEPQPIPDIEYLDSMMGHLLAADSAIPVGHAADAVVSQGDDEATEWASNESVERPIEDLDQPLEIVFVDPAVENSELLLSGLRDDAAEETRWLIYQLSSDEDGIDQITRTLAGLTGVDAIHLLSHGDGQGIQLGNTQLNSLAATAHAGSITQWQDALDADADLLIHGCELASTDSGRNLIAMLAALCDCDVAASDDVTGHPTLGGDWDLEYQIGIIETEIAFDLNVQHSWEHLLAISIDAPSAPTLVATFQEGIDDYSGTQDTDINAFLPDTPNGDRASVVADAEHINGIESIGLVRFDNLFGNGPGQIPLGSTIVSAQLTINAIDRSDAGATLTLHEMQTVWNESSTYNSLIAGLQPGTEYLAAPDGSITNLNRTGLHTITGLEDAVQSWSDGGTNNGWSFINDSSNGFDFSSSEWSTATLRPKLSVEYAAPADQAPSTVDGTVTLDEDTTYTFELSDFGFSDPQGSPLDQIQITRLPSVGSLQLSGVDVTLMQTISAADLRAGALQFTPQPDEYGSRYDSFGFRVSDGLNFSAATGTIAIKNDGFDAGPGGFRYFDDALGTAIPGKADGRYTADGGNAGGGLGIVLGRGPTGGATSGGWTDTFELAIDDTVTIDLDYRLIFASRFEADEFGEAVLLVDGVRFGSDMGDSLYRATGDGNAGEAEDSGWQSVSYEIALTAGTHTITLAAFNNQSTEPSEIVEVYYDNIVIRRPVYNTNELNVNAVDDAIGILSDADASPNVVTENAAIGTTVGVTAMAADPDPQDRVSYSLDLDAGGRFAVNAVTGVIRVSGGLDFETSATENLVVRATSTDGSSATQTVVISVTDVNESPTALGESYALDSGASLSVSVPGVIFNDVDVDGDTLSTVLVLGPRHGTFSLGPGGDFTYTPNAGFFGRDFFLYRVSDGLLSSRIVRATIDVSGVVPDGVGSGSGPGAGSGTGTGSGSGSGGIGVSNGGSSESDSANPPDPGREVESQTETEMLESTETSDANQPSAGGRNALQDSSESARTAVSASENGTPSDAGEGEGDRPDNGQYAGGQGGGSQNGGGQSDGSHNSEDPTGGEALGGEAELQFFILYTNTESVSDGAFSYSPELAQLERVLRHDLAQAIVWSQWDNAHHDEETPMSVFVGAAGAGMAVFSVGYVFWALRGGALMTVFGSSLPAWRFIDPIAMLSAYRSSRRGGDDKLDSLVG